MGETIPQSLPTDPPAPPVTPPVAPANPVVVPASPVTVKKGAGLMWLVILLVVVVIGGSTYFLYTQLQTSSEESLARPPGMTAENSEPNQGFDVEPTVSIAPSVTPTLTSSDNVTDIEKDLSATTIETGNASEFDADLQSL